MTDDELVFRIGPDTSLRPITRDDAPAVYALVDSNRAYLRRWLPWLDGSLGENDTRNFISAAVDRGRAGGGSVWVIELAGNVRGIVGFNWIEPTNRVCEIGYWLADGSQGRGVMTACVARLVEHGFVDLGLNRITITAAVENDRSRAIPMRLRFRQEGVLRQAEWLYDHYVNHVLYALNRDEWSTS